MLKQRFLTVGIIWFVALLFACSTPSKIENQPITLSPTSVTLQMISTSEAPTPPPTSTITNLPTSTPVPTPMTFAERIPIIEYHYPDFQEGEDVMMKPEWFEAQLRWLSENGFQTLSAEELVGFLNGRQIPQKSVVLSFDIGTARHSDYANVIIPALQRYRFKAVIFLLADPSVVVDTCGQGETFCWDELRQWSNEGLVSVESHGISHPHYTTITAEEQKWDAGESRRIIEEKIGKPVWGFAFPYDDTNDRAMRVIESLGYQFATAGGTRADRSVHLSDPERFDLPRVYPYSNPKIYPALYGSGGKTFGQVILEQVALIGGQTLTPTQTTVPVAPSPTPSPNSTTPATTLTPTLQGLADYITACRNIDHITNSDDRLYALARLNFQTDVSAAAQAKLGKPIQIKPSCNVRAANQPRAIVLHYTRGSLSGSLATFQTPDNTSAHYIIDRDGQVYQVVPEGLMAFHVSCFGSRSICVASCPICDGPDGKLLEPNTQSIGIELVNQGHVDPGQFKGPIYEDYEMSFGYRYWEDYPEVQIEALKVLVEDIRARWGIPYEMIIGHYRVEQKDDPGPALNLFWDRNGSPPRKPIFP